MAKKCLRVYYPGNTVVLHADEQGLRKILALFQSIKMSHQVGPDSIIVVGDIILNVMTVQAMTLSNIVETEQDKYIKKVNKQMDEGEWWKRGDNNADEDSQ
jgi:hypothetical protein